MNESRLSTTIRVRSTATLVSLLAIIGAAVSGCSIGPVELGPSGTPVPTIPPTNTVPPPTPTPQPRSLSGSVTDLFTGEPIEGAEVTAGGVLTATSTGGQFYFDDVALNTMLTVEAEGFISAKADTGVATEVDIKLRPSTLVGRVTDGVTGEPLAGVLVKLMPPNQIVTNTITDTLPLPTIELTATTPTTDSFGFGRGLAAPLAATTATVSPTTSTSQVVSPTQALPTGTPLPPTPTATPKPIPPKGEGFVAVYTDESGSYRFQDVPEGAALTFKMPGYKLTKMPVGDTARKEVALEQFKAEAIYITAPVMATTDMFDELLNFVDESRINAVVLNVQNDNSEWVFAVSNPDALAAKNTDIFLEEMPELVKRLKERGIYTIARIVTFQQPTMAKARPDLAVKSSASGKVWIGGELSQQAWLDPSLPEVHEYLIAMTKEVLTLGFDEIQYDYVRFPSDPAPGEEGKPTFSQPITDTHKADFIRQFLEKAHATILPTDAFMSIDIFGYSLWPDRDGRPLNGIIGQVFEKMVDNTDYVCPMIYPSHFSRGEEGCDVPEACAYELVKKSGELAAERFAGKRAKYRPWLQAFDWVRTDYTSAKSTKVADQIRAAEETNAWGWQFWDPWNSYDPRSAFKQP